MSRRQCKISVVPADPSEPHLKGTLFVEGVPRTTKAAFKAACAKNGENMRDVIITFMRRYSIKAGLATPPADYKPDEDTGHTDEFGD